MRARAIQAFFYNAIFFTYALILNKFYDVADPSLFMLPFALGNFLGPVLLGRLFDWRRKLMLSLTFLLAGLLLLGTGFLFLHGLLSAATQTACWCLTFFFGSAAASAAYLTVGELFPSHMRASAISIFYVVKKNCVCR